MSQRRHGSIAKGIFWMFVISILLFWLPIAGALIAGLVGGKKAGNIAAALFAALLPAFAAAVFLFFLASAITGVPLIGFFAALGGLWLCVINIGPLLLGAVIGGAIA
ncbi:MAG: hypothetical protein ACRD10_00165 [Terriglobia bacterium]